MANAETTARPYARAAFDTARSRNALADWSRRLEFAAAAAADPRITSILTDPRIDAATRTGVLGLDGPVDEAFNRFLALLADNDRLAVLPEVHALFETLKNEAERVIKVTVRSAAPLDGAQSARLRDALKKRFGRDVEMAEAIDPDILGGAVLDAGDVVIDGSLKGKLERLHAALMQ